MTALEKLKKFKKFPSTLIINGLTPVGIQLAKTLLEQKGVVVMLDKFTKENKPLLDQLLEFEAFSFIVIEEGLGFLEQISKIDYVIYLDHNNLEDRKPLAPNEFLTKVNQLNKFLEFTTRLKGRFLLSTSLTTHQFALADQVEERYYPKQAAYSDMEQQRYEEKLVFDFYNKYKLDARIIRLGTVYGPNCNVDKEFKIYDLIRQALKKKVLTIHGSGLEDNFIIHVNDATYGLIKAVFAPDTNGEIFNLSNFEDNSTLSIAYALVETGAKAKEINFSETEEEKIPAPYDPTPNLSKIGWKPRIPLEKGLEQTIAYLMGDKEVAEKPIEELEINEKKKEKAGSTIGILEKLGKGKSRIDKNRITGSKEVKSILTTPVTFDFSGEYKKFVRKFKTNYKKNLILTASFLAVYIFILAPIINIAGSCVSAVYYANAAVTDLKENDLNNLSEHLQKLEGKLETGQQAIKFVEPYFKLTKKEDEYNNFIRIIAFTRHISRGGHYSIDLLDPAIRYFQDFSLNTEEQKDHTADMQKISGNVSKLDLAYIELLKANEILSDVNFEKLPFIKNYENTIIEFKDEIFSKITNYKEFVPQMPGILGYPEKKTYLLVLQNKEELRSTGGFIGSYGVITFENGSLTEFIIDDIYNPDGQLKEYIEPPEPLKPLLGDEYSWAMRDANWYPDYPSSARQLEIFFELETERKVDGVIAINSSLIEEILKISGPIYVESMEKEISINNFFEEAEQHHIGFEPGSTAKKDFLGALAGELLQLIAQKDYEFLMKLTGIIDEELNTQEIFIYLNDSEAQKLVTRLGWDGGVTQTDGDYLFIVENNLGGNKVNRYVERKIEGSIVLSEEDTKHALTLTYDNQSQTGDWPGGMFTNHVMLLIPDEVETVTFAGEELTTIQKYNNRLAEKLVRVGFNSQEEFAISYATDPLEDLPMEKKGYTLLFQKQQGVEETYIDLTITAPEGWNIEKLESNLTVKEKDDGVNVFGLMNENIEIEIVYSAN